MSENNSIRVGHVVQLKSGSPQMTVTSVEEHEGKLQAICIWHAEDNLIEELIPVDSLEIVELIED